MKKNEKEVKVITLEFEEQEYETLINAIKELKWSISLNMERNEEGKPTEMTWFVENDEKTQQTITDCKKVICDFLENINA